jgi:hypothetical protein
MAVLVEGKDGSKAPLLALLLLGPLLVLVIRRRSLTLGFYSLASWNLRALGLLAGLTRRRAPPQAAIETRIIRDFA